MKKILLLGYLSCSVILGSEPTVHTATVSQQLIEDKAVELVSVGGSASSAQQSVASIESGGNKDLAFVIETSAPRSLSVPLDLTTPQLIFHGKDVSAKHMHFGGKTVFVTFNVAWPRDLNKNPGTPDTRCTFGLTFLKKQNINTILVGNHYINWYQTTEMEVLLPIINDIIKIYGYTDIITYGSSLGGWAALAFSKKLSATKVIAFCPQVFLDKYSSYKANKRTLKFEDLYTVIDGLNNKSELYVFYSDNWEEDKEYCEVDLKNICGSIGNNKLNLFPEPHNCHHAMLPVQMAGFLAPTLELIMNNQIDTLREIFRREGEGWNKMKAESKKAACCDPLKNKN